MRNLFDQYTQPENRVTHALLTCLDQDRTLLQGFVHWSTGRSVEGRRLEIHEQSLPGDPVERTEEESERRGLPDGCISDGEGWAILIESKFQATVTTDQVKRHLRTGARRGLTDCVVLVLTAKPVKQRLPPRVVVKQWTEVYHWLSGMARKSAWAKICIEYLEAAEARGAAENYLREGQLTVFSGIPFGADEPYTYLQAKRLLGLLRDELRADRRLVKQLGADPESPGRGAITGRNASAVWDFIGLKRARQARLFTQYPHLTLGIRADRLEVYVTVPNGIRSDLRHAVLGRGFEHFERLIGQVTASMVEAIGTVPKAKPAIVVVQRHYPTQRSQAVLDCSLRFDPRTAIRVKNHRLGGVKAQPQWLRAAYEALKDRRSNLQLQIGVDFPYGECPVVGTRKIVRLAADVWLACRPIVLLASQRKES